MKGDERKAKQKSAGRSVWNGSTTKGWRDDKMCPISSMELADAELRRAGIRTHTTFARPPLKKAQDYRLELKQAQQDASN